ncbi:MAG: HlyC/CorC family transporter [Candidatus Hydrogenedentota bacterium]|nr:MAG: HlyC/CorC family transporter [Candidatus Hydrogenedentota bacterium]
MLDSYLLTAIFLALLYALSALISGSETALFSLKPHHRENLGNRRARIDHLLRQPKRLLITILLANLLVNTAAASLMETTLHRLLGGYSVAAAVAVGSIFILVFGEVLPKTAAIRHNVRFALLTFPLVDFLRILSRPLTAPLVALARAVEHGIGAEKETAVTEEDIRSLVSHGEDMGVLDREEERWIHSIFELDKMRANDLMRPRDKIVALPRSADFETALKTIRESGFSRIPIYSDSIDRIIGILHAKDLVLAHLQGRKIPPAKCLRNAVFVPRWRRCDDLLRDLQTRRTHIAIVVNEFGNTAGLVTLEDLLEAIVGDIRDMRQEEAQTNSLENSSSPSEDSVVERKKSPS